MENEFHFTLPDSLTLDSDKTLLGAIQTANKEASASPELHRHRMARATVAFANTAARNSKNFSSAVEVRKDPLDLLRQFEASLLFSRS